MIDLTDKLRVWDEYSPSPGLMKEAADEIERLRAALEFYADNCQDNGKTARDALTAAKGS